MILGSHVSMSGKKMLLGSVEEAVSYGANCFMVYTGAPQNTIRKKVSECKVEEAHKAMKQFNIDPAQCIVHAPYIVNLANADIEKYEFAVSFMTQEVHRTHDFGFKYLVMHPGASRGEDLNVAIANIAKAMDDIFERSTDKDVMILLETMAGKGTEVGSKFEEIKSIIEHSNHKARIGVCLDTCHVNDAGYDIVNNLDGVLEEFDNVIGLGKLKCIHLNDSMNVMGAKKDRHANLGFGKIGFEALARIANHPKLKDVPKILETPYVTESEEHKDRAFPPYKEEIKMLKSNNFDSNLIEEIRSTYKK